MHVKTVKVTNPRNVLVQIPSFVIATWGAAQCSSLEVHYDEKQGQITIKPTVQRRRNAAEQGDGMVRATEA